MANRDEAPPKKWIPREPIYVLFDFSVWINVLVGSDREKFVVYEDIITYRSSFFKTAKCEGRYRDNRPIELLDVDPEIFQYYLQCLYQDKVIVGGAYREDSIFEQLIKTYNLADRLGDSTATNHIIDEIVRYIDGNEKIPNAEATHTIFDHTAEISPLRRLLVDYCIYEGGEEVFEHENGKFNQAFIHAFFKRFRELKVDAGSMTVKEVFATKISSQDRCHYHQHDKVWPRCDEEPGLDDIESIIRSVRSLRKSGVGDGHARPDRNTSAINATEKRQTGR